MAFLPSFRSGENVHTRIKSLFRTGIKNNYFDTPYAKLDFARARIKKHALNQALFTSPSEAGKNPFFHIYGAKNSILPTKGIKWVVCFLRAGFRTSEAKVKCVGSHNLLYSRVQ